MRVVHRLFIAQDRISVRLQQNPSCSLTHRLFIAPGQIVEREADAAAVRSKSAGRTEELVAATSEELLGPRSDGWRGGPAGGEQAAAGESGRRQWGRAGGSGGGERAGGGRNMSGKRRENRSRWEREHVGSDFSFFTPNVILRWQVSCKYKQNEG